MSRKSKLACGASAAAMALILTSTAKAQTGLYAPGDWHNHTTCSDGSLSPAAMLTPPLTQYGLAFLVQTDHGGSYTRDCNYSNVTYNVTTTAASSEADRVANGALWVDTIGPAAILGDTITSTSNANGRTVRAMWRWQNIQQFEYPMIRNLSRALRAPSLFEGYEQIVPGSEHATMSIISGQTATINQPQGNATALARWEYQYDRADADFSGGATIRGVPAGWNSGADSKTQGVDANGNPIAVSIANFSIQNSGYLGHARTVAGVKFLQDTYPVGSFYTPSHVERAGPFNPTPGFNGGFNVETFRDFNSAGPTVAVGFDTQPGHQAAANRGEYGNCGLPLTDPTRGITCPPVVGGFISVGGFSYGGTGIYGAKVGGLWDAMLGEGRNFWFFGSSDYHNRGIFVPPDRRSTADFFPGEYQKTYFPATLTGNPSQVLRAMRAGNAYTVQGDLIRGDLSFTASNGTRTATMGQTLAVKAGSPVTVTVSFSIPVGPNNSPYSFPNPLLAQLGTTQPINAPVIDHMDVITGAVTGVIDRGNPGAYYTAPTNAAYTNATNPSTAIAATYAATGLNPWTVSGNKVSFTYTIPSVTGPMYVRLRGTNIPAATPNATDAAGNPMRDDMKANVVCTDAACPAHLSGVIPGDTTLRVGYDVRAWSDLWVYANPIYIRTSADAPLLAETNAKLAGQLGMHASN